MKKIIFTILILLVFSLCACTNNPNTISEAKLTKREKVILSTTSYRSFIYDFNVDSSYKKLSVWVEKYEFGKLVENKISQITTGIKDNGTIIFAISKTLNNQNQDQSVFTNSINSDGALSESNSLETIMNGGIEGVMGISSSNQTENMPIKNNIVLASMCYQKGVHGMYALTDDFYRDVNKHISEIKDYDVVYLFRAEFTK